MQPGWLAGLAGQGGRLRSGREQAVPDLGHLGEQRIRDLLAEEVRMMELHHALAVLPLAAVRPAITIDDRDVVPAPR